MYYGPEVFSKKNRCATEAGVFVICTSELPMFVYTEVFLWKSLQENLESRIQKHDYFTIKEI